MEISTQLLQEKCKKILDAIGNKKGIAVDTVELKVDGGTLYLSITDKEYYLSVPVSDINSEEHNDFRVVVEADKFLKLVNKTTTSTINLKVSDNILFVKGNGSYKLPLIADKDGNIIKLQKITITNVTSTFPIKNTILQSILKYNARIFSTSDGASQYPFLYMDGQGAISIVRCACVNSFTLEQPVSLFLTEKLVKLFKLFKSEDVNFTLGFDELPNGILQQKVCFSDGDAELYAILTTDSQVVDKFPAATLRNIATTVPPYTVVISKAALVGALDRIALFKTAQDARYAQTIRLTFEYEGVKVEDYSQNNSELVFYSEPCEAIGNEPEGKENYSAMTNVDDLTSILNNCEDEFLTVSFGKGALYITKANIINLIPELKRRGN